MRIGEEFLETSEPIDFILSFAKIQSAGNYRQQLDLSQFSYQTVGGEATF